MDFWPNDYWPNDDDAPIVNPDVFGEITERGSIALDTWRSIMCLGAYPFWQLGQWPNQYPNTRIPIDLSHCTPFVYERCHQGCTLAGRDQICQAILEADRMFQDFTHYPPSPKPLSTEFYGKFGGGILQLDHYKIKALGQQRIEYIDTIPFNPVTLTDTNGDSLYDMGSITIDKPEGSSADEIVLFFDDPDRGLSNPCRHEIRPLTVKDNGATFTITFPAWVLVKPVLYELYTDVTEENILDPQDLSIYPTQFQVYRRWIDPTLAVTIWRKPIDCSCGWTSESVCYTSETTTACLLSAEQGLVEVTLPRDGTCCPRCAVKLSINYVAGDTNQETLIARLAASLLHSSPCCSPTEVLHWQAEYVAVSEKGRMVTTLSEAERSSLFGTRRGGVDAYRALRSKRKLKIGTI